MEHLNTPPVPPPPPSDDTIDYSGIREEWQLRIRRKIEAWKRSLKISTHEIAELPPNLGIALFKFLNINYTD